MPPIALTNNWPSHWYNNTQIQWKTGFLLVCPADDCNRTFKEEEFENMRAHWNEVGTATSPSHHSLNDHVILFAMSFQRKCVHLDDTNGQPCAFDPNDNLKTLLNHEQCEHGRTEMSTIGKYLVLVRKDLLTLPAQVFEKYAFNRLVSKIVTHPRHRDAILKKGNTKNMRHMDEEEKRKCLARILAEHNVSDGRRSYAVTPQQDFLANMAPDAGDSTDWPQAWSELRSMYAEGQI